MRIKRNLTSDQREYLLRVLKSRFDKNMNRHKGFEWSKILMVLEKDSDKLWSLNEMERTGGEPDVVTFDINVDEYIFYDCSLESPNGRRSVCYDHEALEIRKKFKPKNSAINMASEMGIELLTEEQYRELQNFCVFDLKTSSWVQTPAEIRSLGGAIFCDFRYNNVFTYHNGAESYYGVRGFRGMLKL